MTAHIGQASHDERGRYTGGRAGNQSGDELNSRAAYLYNWRTLIRFKDPGRARKCAQAMAEAVANTHIGYDQGERNSILPAARAVGFQLSRIAVDCECDCSSLVGVCGIAAGCPEGAIYKGGNLCYTGNLAARFKATGLVDVHTSADYVASTSKWRVGDILVSDSHTVIVVSGTAPSGSGSSHAASGDIDALARAVIQGRYGSGDARKAALGGQYEAVQARVNQMLGSGVTTDKPAKGIDDVAREVINGDWGNDPARSEKLKAAGYDPAQVQARVNEMVGGGSAKKDLGTVAREVVNGDWGNGDERRRRLAAAGYDYDEVQSLVNRML